MQILHLQEEMKQLSAHDWERNQDIISVTFHELKSNRPTLSRYFVLKEVNYSLWALFLFWI